MPGSKSAEKAARVSERKKIRNRSVKSAIKTKITKSEKLIAGSELESARAAVAETISDLDRAVKKVMAVDNNRISSVKKIPA